MMASAKAAWALIAATVIATAGCGGPASPPVDRAPISLAAASGSKVAPTWLLVDRSPSFSPVAREYVPEIEAVVRDVATARGRVLAAGFDGSPLTTARIVSIDFSQPPPGLDDLATITRFNQARAIGFTAKLRGLLSTPYVVPGSGILEALALAATAPGDVYIWTDAIEHEPGSFDLGTATQVQFEREVRVWQERLRDRFARRTVTMIGVGRGASSMGIVGRAHELFTAVVEKAGGGRLRWLQVLAETPGR